MQSRILLNDRAPAEMVLDFEEAESGAGLISPADAASLAEAAASLLTLTLILWDRWRGRRKPGAEDSAPLDEAETLADMDKRLQEKGHFGQRVLEIDAENQSARIVLGDSVSRTIREFEVRLGDGDVYVRVA